MDEIRIGENRKDGNLRNASLVIKIIQLIILWFLIWVNQEYRDMFLLLAIVYLTDLSITFYSYSESNLMLSNVIRIKSRNTEKILSLIDYIYNNGYKNRFNPRLYKSLNIEIDERQWMETISMLVKSGQATEKLELTCPNCHDRIDSYIKYQDIPLDQTIRCIHCNHEFEVSEEHIVPMYSFSESFDPTQDLSMPEKHSGSLVKKD